MGNKHIKRYSTSCVIREIQIKTIIRYNYTPIKKIKIQNIDNINAVEHVAIRTLTHCWWEGKMVLWKTVCQFLYKTKYSLTV